MPQLKSILAANLCPDSACASLDGSPSGHLTVPNAASRPRGWASSRRSPDCHPQKLLIRLDSRWKLPKPCGPLVFAALRLNESCLIPLDQLMTRVCASIIDATSRRSRSRVLMWRVPTARSQTADHAQSSIWRQILHSTKYDKRIQWASSLVLTGRSDLMAGPYYLTGTKAPFSEGSLRTAPMDKSASRFLVWSNLLWGRQVTRRSHPRPGALTTICPGLVT